MRMRKDAEAGTDKPLEATKTSVPEELAPPEVDETGTPRKIRGILCFKKGIQYGGHPADKEV